MSAPRKPTVRRFRMIDEYEASVKGRGNLTYSYGPDSPDDVSLTHWNAMVMDPTGRKMDNFYTLKLTCGEGYPAAPPIVRFVTRINLPAVNQKTGVVDKLPLLKNWNADYCIETVLQSLRDEMKRSGHLPQPPEGSDF